METVIVAAVGRNGAIGIEGRLPWRIPEDMARFKDMTMGNALVMGRATFESIGRPLPGRTTVVLTTRPDWAEEGVTVTRSLVEALEVVDRLGLDAYIAGGASVYEAGLEFANRLELTEVDAAPEADTYFPEVDWSGWREVERLSHPGFDFVTFERK